MQELTTEASDAVLLGFASPEDVALPPAAPKREEAARAEQALKRPPQILELAKSKGPTDPINEGDSRNSVL